MAGVGYPLGRPDTVRVISDPGLDQPTRDLPLDPVDRDLLLRDHAQRRATDPMAPPESMPGDPWVVPRALWLKAAGDNIRRRGSGSAIRNDGADMAFNISAQGARESAIDQFNPRPTPEPLQPDYAGQAIARFGGGAGLAAIARDDTQFQLEADRRTQQWADSYRATFQREPTQPQLETQRIVEQDNINRDIGDLLAHPALTAGQTLTAAAGIAGELIAAPFAAARGFLTGQDPMDSVQRAVRGLADPSSMPWLETFRGLGFVRLLPDNDFLHLNVTDQDIAQWMSDPTQLAGFNAAGGSALTPHSLVHADFSPRTAGAVVGGALTEAFTGSALAKIPRAFEMMGIGGEVVDTAYLGATEMHAGINPFAIINSQALGVPPTRYVADLPDLATLADHVQRSQNPVARALVGKSGINPSILLDTELGRIGLGYKQGEMAAEGLTEVAMSGIDAQATKYIGQAPFGRNGWLFKVDREGSIGNVIPKAPDASLAWNDVLSNPGNYDFTPEQQSFVDLVHRVIGETDEMRVRAGLPTRALDTSPEGWFYVPRSVQELDALAVHGFTNPGQARTFEEMRQGLAAGVRYSNDLRATIASHIRGAYHEVNAKRLTEAVQANVIPRDSGEFGLDAAGERVYGQAWGRGGEFFLPQQMAQELERNVPSVAGADSANWANQAFQDVGDAIRFHAAALDNAAPFLQGLPVLMRHPATWAKGTVLTYQSLLDPTIMSRYISNHIDTFQRMAQHGVPVGDNEFFSALQTGRATNVFGALQKATSRLPEAMAGDATLALETIKHQTYGRFSGAYDIFLAASRSMMWDALEKKFMRDGSDGFALARHIRNMTGGLDSRALGVTANQRGFESTWLAFAPRFARSTAALAGELFDSDPVLRKEAARSVGQLLGGVTGAYIATGIALGKAQDEIVTGLNPLEGKKFLSHEINGDWVGVGGVARGYIQLIAQSVALGYHVAQHPLQSAQDFEAKDLFDAQKNPIVGFMANRGAVATNLLGSLVEWGSGGRVDAVPFTEINSTADLMKHLGKSSLPFAVQGHLDGEQVTTSVFSETGFRTSPQAPSERRTEILTEAAQQGGFAAGFDDKEPAAVARARAQLQNDPTRLAELDQLEADRVAQWRRDVTIRSDPLARAALAAVDARDAITAEIAKHPDDLAHIRQFASDQQAIARGIRAQPDVKAALAALKPSQKEWQQDLDQYFAVFDEPTPDLRDEAEAKLREQIGPERMGRVLQNVFAVPHDMPEQWNRIQQDKQALTEGGFFDLGDAAWKQAQTISAQRLAQRSTTTAQREILQQVVDAPSRSAWTDLAIKGATDKLIAGGMERSVAVQRAQNEVGTGPVSTLFDAALLQQRVNWTRSNQPLAREAIALGYLGAGDVNSVLSGTIGRNGAPTPTTARPAGQIVPGNIDLSNRPRVSNPDGSISTVRSISVEQDGRTYLIPTVVGNKVVSNADAIAHFRATGEHLGAFTSTAAADAYGQQLHQQEAQKLAPHSANIEDMPLNIRLVAEHDAGASYGELATKHGISRDAVIGRIKRTRDQSPPADQSPLLATFVRGEHGGIVGMDRSALHIVRDADGRPLGIGMSA